MTAFSSDLINFEMRGKIAVLTLNRPEKRNAVNETLIEDINRFQRSPQEALAVVLGASEDHFCAGLDLSQHRTSTKRFEISRYGTAHSTLFSMADCPSRRDARGGNGWRTRTCNNRTCRVAEPITIYQLPEGAGASMSAAVPAFAWRGLSRPGHR